MASFQQPYDGVLDRHQNYTHERRCACLQKVLRHSLVTEVLLGIETTSCNAEKSGFDDR
jgi:hypothetical protein